MAAEPELLVSYHASDPIELVPDPVLPPVKPPYPSQKTAAMDPVESAPVDLPEFPLYRAPKAARMPVAAAPVVEAPVEEAAPEPSRTEAKSYEEMVRALVYPEETAPYIPPSRPTAPRPQVVPRSAPVAVAPPSAAAPIPSPVPAIAETEDAPPFYYKRKSVPGAAAPAAPTADAGREKLDVVRSFIQRPSIPLRPGTG